MPAPQGTLTTTPVVLLTLEYAGRIVRLSSEPVSVVDRDGVSHLFIGGLPPLEVGNEIAMFSVADAATLDVEILFPLDVPLLTSEGHLLSQARAEVSLWRQGDTWEQRCVLLSGRVRDARFTVADAAIRFVISADPGDDINTQPDPSVNFNYETTWSSLFIATDDLGDGEGKVYPIVFGYPGMVDDVNAASHLRDMPATPAYIIQDTITSFPGITRHARGAVDVYPDSSTFLLCSGWAYPQTLHIWGGDGTGTGTEADESDPTFYEVWWGRDDAGNPATFLEILAGSAVGYDTTVPAFVSWTTGSMFDRETGPFRWAGRILRWALEQTSLPVDWARTDTAAGFLSTIELGGYWDEPCAPWEWIRDNLLPILPVSMVIGPDGIYPVVWRHWATARDAVYSFDDAINCTIEGEIEEEGAEETVSHVSIEYAFNAKTGAYLREASWVARDRVGRRESGSAYIQTSVLTEYGTDSVRAIQSDLVYRDAAANQILAWQVCAYAHPRRIVHVVATRRAGFVDVGDVVTITSADRHLDAEIAHVKRAVWRGDQVLLDLVIFWRPL